MKDYINGPAPGFLTLWWRRGALFPIVLAIFTVVTAVGSYNSLKFGLAFDERGVVALAQVASKREQKVRRDDRTHTEYYVTFAYTAEDQKILHEKKVDRDLYQALLVCKERDIRYLPKRPRQMEHTIAYTWKSGQSMRGFSLAFGLGTLGVFWWSARSAVEAIRARKFGAAERAHVVMVDQRTRRTKNSVQTYYVLVWQDALGRAGESLEASSDDRCVPYPAGSRIEVFRDSRGKTWWVGDVGPRADAPTVPSVGKRKS